MKNLENFGVQELNRDELKELNGGFLPPVFWEVAKWVGLANLIEKEYNEFMAELNSPR